MRPATAISSAGAPAPVGPYSQARRHGDLLFISGQLPLDPQSGEMAVGPEEQMRRALLNVAAIAEAAGASMADVVKTVVLVTDLSIFGRLNAIYGTFFEAPYPARATYQVAALPMGATVEIEAVVALPPAA